MDVIEQTNIRGRLSSLFSGISEKYSEMMSSTNTAVIMLKIVILVLVIMFGIKIIKSAVNKVNSYRASKPWILKGTKNAKKRMLILQDPAKHNSITLGRSDNEFGGLEMTYVFWMYVDDWAYKYGQWKHVMHKGNDTSWPLRAPGIWLHPKDNSMRVYMNTFKDIGEYVDVEGLPLNKWVHVAVAVRQRNLDIFINGNLVKRKLLEGIPKQNFGDLYINSFRGFSGYLSNIRYYDYYISFSELDNHLSDGPSSMPCVDSKEAPPYFVPNWWANAK